MPLAEPVIVDSVAIFDAGPLAQFRLRGLGCVILALPARPPPGAARLGTLSVGAERFAIYGLECAQAAEPAADIDSLTARELEIALLIAAGQEAKTIARRLRISFHTVRVHLGRIYAKLKLHKQTELAARIAAHFGR